MVSFRTNTKGLECISKKSRNTWSNRQIWPWSVEWNRAKANRILPRECIGHSKHPLPTTQEKTLHMDIPRCSTPKSDWFLYYILCSQRWRSSLQSAKIRLGTDYSSDHEIPIAKFRLKLKKVGKTTRPFRYDLNQIPYNYALNVRNRFKGLDLIDRVPGEHGRRSVTLYRRQGSRPAPTYTPRKPDLKETRAPQCSSQHCLS